MGKNQQASGLTNIIHYDNNGNITFVSGSTTLMSISSSGAITTTGVISGSNVLTASYANNAELLDGLDSTAFATTGAYSATSGSLYTVSSSAYATSGSLSTASGSFNTRVSALEATGSALSSSILSVSSSAYATSGSLSAASGSFNTRVATIESKYATTGSNNFRAPQYVSDTTVPTGFANTTGSIYTDGGLQVTKDAYFSSSMFIKGNLTIYGTQSVAYITSSQLNIATNLITVNTATPAVRFGGLAVYDSGSTGTNMTGSLLWDSQNNSWIYDNPSGSGNYDSAMVIMGPRNASALGSEQGLTCNYLVQGHGHHHVTSSQIYHDSSTTCFYGGTSYITAGGAACFTGCINTSGVTLGNGQYLKGVRNSGALVINLLGIESGTDRTMMTITNDYVVQNGSLSPVMTLTTAGAVCFTGQVCASQFISAGNITSAGDVFLCNGNPILHLQRSNNSTSPAARINFETSQGTVRWQAATNQSIGTGFEINEGDGTNNRVYIANGGAATLTSNDSSGNRTTINDVVTIYQTNPSVPYSGFGSAILFKGTTYNSGGSGVAGVRNWGRIGMYLNDSSVSTSGESMFFAVAPADNSDTINTAMTISPSGNVGINSSSPQDKLEVKSGYVRLYDPSSNINAGYPIYWTSDNGGTNVSFAGIGGLTTSAGNRTGDLLFYTATAGVPTEKARITSNGELHIIGAATSGYNYGGFIYNTDTTFDFYASNTAGVTKATRFFYSGNPSAEAMRIGSTGLIGIGDTSNATTKLSIISCSDTYAFTVKATPVNQGSYFWNSNNDPIALISFQRSNTGTFFGQARSCQATIFAAGCGPFTIGTQTTQPLILGVNDAEAVRVTNGGCVGIGTSAPSQKLHLIGGFLQTAGNSSWYRNVFERNVSTWDTFVSFAPQSSPQYTYGYINITASGYVNGTSAGGSTSSRWYYSITNNAISVSVIGTDISAGSQAPSIRLIVTSNVINVQAQSATPASTSYTTMFVDAMLASGYINGTYWLIS